MEPRPSVDGPGCPASVAPEPAPPPPAASGLIDPAPPASRWSAPFEHPKPAAITTDPKRDTPEVLADYIHRFNPRFEALTGDLDTIAKVGKSIGIFVDTGEQLASGGYDPNSHGTYIIAVNSDHQAPLFWRGETSPSQFADDIRFLLTEKPEKLTRSSSN